MMLILILSVFIGVFYSPAKAEVVQIKTHVVWGETSSSNPDLVPINPDFVLLCRLATVVSTESLMITNNPFPNSIFQASFGLTGPSSAQADSILESRFCRVVGVPGTMILDEGGGVGGSDSFSWNLTSFSFERPFFSLVDKLLLNSLTEWTWDGNQEGPVLNVEGLPMSNTLGPLFPMPINIGSPSPVSGTFNQSEQRFYVSDGRQYQVVPEPSSLSLLLAGGAVFAAVRRHKVV